MNREAKVGAFVLAAIAVMIYFILQTSDSGGLDKSFWDKKIEMQILKAEFANASGVREGTGVYIAGVKVGKVAGLSLDGSVAVVDLAIRADIPLYDNAKVVLESKGVLGEKLVAIYPGLGNPLGVDQRVVGSIPVSLDTITTTINDLGKDLMIITSRIKESTADDKGQNRIELIAANIERLSNLLVEITAENKNKFNSTMTNISAMSADLRRDLPDILKEFKTLASQLSKMAVGNEGNIDDTMTRIASVSKKLDSTMSSVETIAKKVEKGEGSVGKLLNDDETVDNLNKFMGEATDAVAQVGKFVGRMNRLQIDFELKNEVYSENNSTKNYFSMNVIPSENKYYHLGVVGRDVDHYPLRFNYSQTDHFDADGNLIEREETRVEVPFLETVFEAQLAYRFNNFWIRGGFFESTGGAALDYMFNDDKGRIYFEAYEFNRPDEWNAHVKFGMEYKYSDIIRIHAGIDDLFVDEARSVYLGVGIRWKDDDLKPLITSLGSLF